MSCPEIRRNSSLISLPIDEIWILVYNLTLVFLERKVEMNALPYVSPKITSDLLDATIRLQQITHEPWTVDWSRFALVCRHGVVITHRSVLACRPVELHGLVARRHDSANARVHPCEESGARHH